MERGRKRSQNCSNQQSIRDLEKGVVQIPARISNASTNQCSFTKNIEFLGNKPAEISKLVGYQFRFDNYHIYVHCTRTKAFSVLAIPAFFNSVSVKPLLTRPNGSFWIRGLFKA